MSEIRITDWGMFTTAFAQFVASLVQTRLNWIEFKRNKEIDELKKNLNGQLKLIKNLEEKQKNHKKEERSELKNLAKKFEEMHTSIFKDVVLPQFLYNKIGKKGWQELDHKKLKGKEEDDYNESFFEKMRKIINELKTKEEENSFIVIVKTTQEPFFELSSSKEKDESINFIKSKEYKEIFSKSTSFYSYFDNLNNLISGDSTKKLLFSLDMMGSLYIKILAS